jgi:peptidoglycan hydrolase CwlO-like protein
MKLTSYLYIFALAVLCSPGFFIKNKPTQNILYSLIFTVLLYITFDFVNKYTENYEQYNVDVKGVDSLVDLIKTQSGGNDSKKIDINNQLFQEAGADDANCWNALGKNQKELEIIKVQLDSYAGSKESIDNLNTQLDSQKQEVEKLQNGLKGFEGTKTEIDQINIQIKKYQTEIDKLKQQLVLYNQTEKTIGEINNQISKVQTVITDLNTKISECNTLNSGKEENIATLTGNIREQGTTIFTLETRKTNLTNDITSQNNTINSLRSRINSREGCDPTTLLFTSSGDNPNFKNIWSGWYNSGGSVTSGDGKRSAYDTLPLRKIRITDSNGNDIIWDLQQQYRGQTILSIVSNALPSKERSINNGSATWTNGHANIGTLIQNNRSKNGVSNLRIGVGDGTSDDYDWALFMPVSGNGQGDMNGTNCYNLGGEYKTTNANVGTISLYGG